MKIINNTILSIMILGLLALSCSSSTDTSTPTPATTDLEINLTGLEALGDKYEYEGWIKNGTDVYSTGKFSSVTFPQTFKVDAAKLAAAKEFIVSIEPKPDADPKPANTKVLSGSFTAKVATLNSNVVADFSGTNAAGKYILATPTTTIGTDEEKGFWFVSNAATPAVGLTLPTLSAGWKYEGWVVLPSKTPISTGTFTSATGADSDAANSPYKGADGNGPAFPGGDFVTGTAQEVDFTAATFTLKGATIVVSVEPDPDNDPAPFALKPLAHTVAGDATTHTPIDMAVGPKPLLNGTATRK